MKIPFFAVALGCMIVLSGCGDTKAKKEAKNYVGNYVSTLQFAYLRADLAPVEPYTTSKELKKLFPVIQALKATGNIMKTEIIEFKMGKVSISDNSATVTTNEKWRYWWEDGKTGRVTKPKTEESYRLEYRLVNETKGWKVDSIRNLDE